MILKIAITCSRHWGASRPTSPPLFTCLVTCHRYEFTAIVSWGGNCFYMTTEFLLPLGVITHCCYPVIVIKAQKGLQTVRDSRSGRFLLTKVELLQFYLVLHMLHDNIDMLNAQQLAKGFNCPAKGFNCPANCLVFFVGGCHTPHTPPVFSPLALIYS